MLSPTALRTESQIAHGTLAAAYETFRRTYPTFDSTWKLDDLRAKEYTRLDREGHVYLDYTGGSLYAECQVREHMGLLCDGVFGNPHSRNLTSLAMTHLVFICAKACPQRASIPVACL